MSLTRSAVVGMVLGVSPLLAVADADRLPGKELVPIWRSAVETWGMAAAARGHLFVQHVNHQVLSLDLSTGVVAWRQPTGQYGQTVEGSRLEVCGDLIVAGDYDLLAFDEATGALRWRFAPTDGYGPGYYLGPALDGVVVAGSPAGRLYAIDCLTGQLRWSVAIATDGNTSVFRPASDGRRVFAGYTTFSRPNRGGVVAVDLATGLEQWRYVFRESDDPSIGTGAAGGPVIANDTVFVASGEGTVRAFDVRSGAVRWSIPPVQKIVPGLAGVVGQDFRALARSSRTLVVGSLTGYLVAYDLDTHVERWRHKTDGAGSMGFDISSDDVNVYVPYLGGRLDVLSLSDGKERWHFGDWNTPCHWPPLSLNGLVCLGAGNEFMCLRP